MKTINYTEKKREFVRLYKETHLTQRRISDFLNISEQTICKWTKKLNLKIKLLKDTRTKLIQRLNKELENPKTTSTDVHNYASAISVLSKQIDTIKSI